MKEARAVWGRRGGGDGLKTSPVSPQPVTRTHLAAGRPLRVLGRPGESTGGQGREGWDGDPMPPCPHGAPSAGDGDGAADEAALVLPPARGRAGSDRPRCSALLTVWEMAMPPSGQDRRKQRAAKPLPVVFFGLSIYRRTYSPRNRCAAWRGLLPASTLFLPPLR